VTLLEHAIDAHGGLARWREIRSIDVTLRCGGIAMPLKGQPSALRQFMATVDPWRPRVELHGIGMFDSSLPRPAGMARPPRWNNDDVVHFAGYALWGYLVAPFVFAEPDDTDPAGYRAGVAHLDQSVGGEALAVKAGER